MCEEIASLCEETSTVSATESDGTRTYRTRCDWGERDSLIVTISEAITELTDANPPDLAPLDESIDPDALADIFGPTSSRTIRSQGVVEFTHGGCEVTVHASGKVVARTFDG